LDLADISKHRFDLRYLVLQQWVGLSGGANSARQR